jgi:peptidoglycan hydrolase CwlO-like protein
MEKKDISGKVQSLQKHLEKVKNLLTNTTTKRTPSGQEAYTAWVKLEIKRTESKIAELTMKA